MANNLPYLSSPGNIAKAFSAIKAAAVPERVNQDFVKTVLKIPGGSGDQMTTFLKKIGFARSDGTPSEVYTRFRNPTTSGVAAAQALRHGYAPLYRRNEFMHLLPDAGLLGLIVEETGQASDSSPVRLSLSAIKALKQFASFDELEGQKVVEPHVAHLPDAPSRHSRPPAAHDAGIGLNLGYTININLPATTDQSVYNAIFKSIKDNLLTGDDA